MSAEDRIEQFVDASNAIVKQERGKAFDAGVSACAAILMLTGDEATMRLTMDERRQKAVKGDW